MTPSPLDEHWGALGEQLDRGAAKADRRRRARTAGGITAVALGTGLAAAFLLPGGAAKLDPVAEAKAAVDPAGGGILHYEIRNASMPANAPLSEPPPESPATAVWTTTEARPSWRARYPADGRPWACSGAMIAVDPKNGRFRPIGTLMEPTERAFTPHRFSTYSPFSRAMTVRKTSPDTAYDPPVNDLRLDVSAWSPGDPVAELRQALDRGVLRDAGVINRDGTELRRFVGEVDERTERQRRRDDARGVVRDPAQVVYLVDPQDFTPVELRVKRHLMSSRRGAREHYRWLMLTTSFAKFERLPDTPESHKLLSIDAPANTTVIKLPRTGQPRELLPTQIRTGRDPAAKRRCEAARKP